MKLQDRLRKMLPQQVCSVDLDEAADKIDKLEAQIAAFTSTPAPHEAYTQGELKAYAFGWWRALEVQRHEPKEHGVWDSEI